MVIIMNNSNYLASFNKLINWYLNESMISQNDQTLDKVLAENIAIFYKNIMISKSKLKSKKIKIKKYSFQNLNKKKLNFLQPIKQLQLIINKNLKNYLVDFLIHGSIATKDFSIGWSDLDTYIIIKNDVIGKPNKLLKFKEQMSLLHNFLYKIDPLQHHGFIFCAENYLEQYQSFMLPINVLKESRSLINSNVLYIREQEDLKFPRKYLISINKLLLSSKKTGFLNHHKYKDKFLLNNFKDKNTMYQMKYFLSVIMTLPTYYLHSIGMPVYKKKSFKILRNIFSKNWEIIETATIIRMKWSKREKHPHKGNEIPQWLINELGEDYFKRAHDLSNDMVQKMKFN